MNRNRLVNRPIQPAWMADALDIAASGGSGDEGRGRLEIRLRDASLADVARAKVVEMLHPVWINPPDETRAFIAWAIEHSPEAPDLRLVNLVALMGTYPFFADVLGAVGRLLRTNGEVDAVLLRDKLKARWGDRDSVSLAERKCVLTLRWFGVLDGDRGSGMSRQGSTFELGGQWALWSLAGLLLGREAELTDALTVETAPEFFFANIKVPASGAHPLLERMTSGDRRTTFGLRQGL